jgi:hypothetical protein
MEIIPWIHGSHWKIMVTKDMEILTCIEVIISIDASNFCAPSIQWKFHLDTWKHFHGRLWFHELFWQCLSVRFVHNLSIWWGYLKKRPPRKRPSDISNFDRNEKSMVTVCLCDISTSIHNVTGFYLHAWSVRGWFATELYVYPLWPGLWHFYLCVTFRHRCHILEYFPCCCPVLL